MNSYAHKEFTDNWACCHVYSLPYYFDEFLFVTIRFTGGMLDKVRRLVMSDIRSFVNRFFQIISQSFPPLESLLIINEKAKQNEEHSPTLITFPHLLRLDLKGAHIDYARQFLSDENTSLSRLIHLEIGYETLSIVTEDFTNEATQHTCAQIKSFVMGEPIVRSQKLSSDFSSL